MKRKKLHRGRRTRMKLPILKNITEDGVWGTYQTVKQASESSGYTPVAIRTWILNNRIEAWLYKKLTVVKKDNVFPPLKVFTLNKVSRRRKI